MVKGQRQWLHGRFCAEAVCFSTGADKYTAMVVLPINPMLSHTIFLPLP